MTIHGAQAIDLHLTLFFFPAPSLPTSVIPAIQLKLGGMASRSRKIDGDCETLR